SDAEAPQQVLQPRVLAERPALRRSEVSQQLERAEARAGPALGHVQIDLSAQQRLAARELLARDGPPVEADRAQRAPAPAHEQVGIAAGRRPLLHERRRQIGRARLEVEAGLGADAVAARGPDRLELGFAALEGLAEPHLGAGLPREIEQAALQAARVWTALHQVEQRGGGADGGQPLAVAPPG